MKTLLIANRKGGVGKSAIATQLAHYLADKRDLRVLVIDLDNQGNTSDALKPNDSVATASYPAVTLFKTTDLPDDVARFLLIPADAGLAQLERDHAEHNRYASNFRDNLKALAPHFDVCIIDPNPASDIRVTAALVSATHTLAPFQFNQESIKGLGQWLSYVNTVKTKLNPELNIIGILPSLVEPTPFQKANAQQIFTALPQFLMRLPDGSFGQIKSSSAIAKAQADNVALWKAGTSTARDVWKTIEPTFSFIADAMQEQ